MGQNVGQATISKAIQWAEDHKILVRQNRRFGTSNEYYWLNRLEWNLPKPLSKEKGTSIIDASLTEGQNCSNESESSINESTSLSELHTININYNKTYLHKIYRDKDLISSKKKPYQFGIDFSEWPETGLDEIAFLFFNEYLQYYKIPCEEKLIKKFYTEEMAEFLFEKTLFLLERGGTSRGWIKHEFVRLARQHTKHMPQPKFLMNDHSVKSYLSSLSKVNISGFVLWTDEIYPFTGKKIIGDNFKDDPEYNLAKRSAAIYLKCKSIKQYERIRWVKGIEGATQLRPYLFIYLMSKYTANGLSIPSTLDEVTSKYETETNDFFDRPCYMTPNLPDSFDAFGMPRNLLKKWTNEILDIPPIVSCIEDGEMDKTNQIIQ